MRKLKPVIGLSYYGTHGSEMNDKTVWLYELAAGIPEKSLEILTRSLNNPNDEKPFLELLKLILKKNPLKKQGGLNGRWIAFCIVLILILAALLFLAPFLIPKIETLKEHHASMILLTTLVASMISGALGGILNILYQKLYRKREKSPVDLVANIAFGLGAGVVCSLIFVFFLWWFIYGIELSNLNYNDMAQRSAWLSALISLAFTLGGVKAARMVESALERLFSWGTL